MIRINLVAEGRKPVVARQRDGGAPFLASENIALYTLLAGFLVFAAVFGVWFWRLNGTVNANQSEIRVKEKRVDELREIIDKVEAFERKQALLEQKIAVITDLKNSQRGPVEIMDEVSKALPELLWLDRLEQNGDLIKLTGRAFNLSAISTFIENLDRVPVFQEPVLRDSNKARGDVWNFQIEFQKLTLPLADGEGDDLTS
jgi:type IV pilus assembly protein PilN